MASGSTTVTALVFSKDGLQQFRSGAGDLRLIANITRGSD
jgi:hypothetical protein